MFKTTIKFFDVDTSETGTGGAPVETPSAAAQLATKGILVEAGQGYSPETANINTGNKEETTTPAETQTVETTTEPTQGEQANPEIPAAVAELPKVETPIETPPAVVQQSWQEVLRQKQPNEVFKELGYDDSLVSLFNDIKGTPEMVAFYQHWKNNGNTTAYLKEANTDYSKMPAEDVMRHQLRLEYPGSDERTIDILFEEEILDKYKLDPDKFSPEEAERGRLILEAKASKYREQFVANQKNFLLPKPPEPQPVVAPDNSEELRQQQEFEALKTTISNDPFSKEVATNKQLTYGEGEDKFKFPVDPQALYDNIFTEGKSKANLFFEKTEPNGTKTLVPDSEKLLWIAAIGEYGPKAILGEIAKHYKSLGGKSAIAPIENAKIPDGSTPAASPVAPKTAAQALAQQGYVSHGG